VTITRSFAGHDLQLSICADRCIVYVFADLRSPRRLCCGAADKRRISDVWCWRIKSNRRCRKALTDDSGPLVSNSRQHVQRPMSR